MHSLMASSNHNGLLKESYRTPRSHQIHKYATFYEPPEATWTAQSATRAISLKLNKDDCLAIPKTVLSS